MATPDPNGGSEYGGVPGLIQPPPHDPQNTAPNEVLWQVYKTDPAAREPEDIPLTHFVQ